MQMRLKSVFDSLFLVVAVAAVDVACVTALHSTPHSTPCTMPQLAITITSYLLQSSFDIESDHGARAVHLPLAQLVLWMTAQT